MASKVCELVEKLVLPFAEQCGVELVEVEYAKKVNGMNLTIFMKINLAVATGLTELNRSIFLLCKMKHDPYTDNTADHSTQITD